MWGCEEGGRRRGCGFIAHSGPPFESPNFSLKSSSDILTSSSDNSYPYTALAATKHDQPPSPSNHLSKEERTYPILTHLMNSSPRAP